MMAERFPASLVAVVVAAVAIAAAADKLPRRHLSPWAPTPQVGEQRLLVLHTAFSDSACSFASSVWTERFFGGGGFSKYFQANSYGRLHYTGEVVGLNAQGQPTQDSTSIDCIKVPETVTYYANDLYGFKTTRCSRQSISGIVLDALTALDAAGFDFSPYADPATKELRNVVVMGAAQTYHTVKDPAKSFLSTAYNLQYVFRGCPANTSLKVNPAGYFVSANNFSANLFTFCTQHNYNTTALASLGECVHEMGHALGLIDEYDVGQYSVMGAGLWGPDAKGFYPAYFSAWDKMWVGWLEPMEVQASEVEVEYTLRPSHTSQDALVLRLQNSTEYFVIENRQVLAFGDPPTSSSFCPGVLIWHVDGTIATNTSKYWASNTVNDMRPGNNVPPHLGVAVCEADADNSLRLSQDDFQCDDTYRLGNGAFSGDTAKLWSGAQSGVSVRVLSVPDAQGAVRISVRCSFCNASGVVLSSTGPWTCDAAPAGLPEYCARQKEMAADGSYDCLVQADNWTAQWSTAKTAYCCQQWEAKCASSMARASRCASADWLVPSALFAMVASAVRADVVHG